MNGRRKIEKTLGEILGQYQHSFSRKTYQEENNDVDLLMEAFAITPELKRENRQYWGRELGMCWQRLVTGSDTYTFIHQLSGFDLKRFLQTKAGVYKVSR